MTGKKNTAWLQSMIRRFGSREAVTKHMQAVGAIGGKAKVKKGFALKHFNRHAAPKKKPEKGDSDDFIITPVL